MAKQKGPFKFEGKLGNLLGYLDDGEYHVKTLSKVDEEKRRYAPQYEVTRQNEAEFGVATRCGQLFRQAMKHITQRWTKRDYPPKVMQVMLQTLRSDTTHIKGQKMMHCGLKNASSQKAFRHLEIYTKKSYEHYRSCLMHETEDPLVWKMNHQDLWSKRDDGDTKCVKLGFLHIDFDQKIANYEDALTIECKRKDNIDISELSIAPSGDTKLPWTFVIMQVWRDGDKNEPTGMLFMSVLQVIDTNAATVDGLIRVGEHGESGKEKQERRIVDANGVNWDVFLDGYLDDGFADWVIGEEDGKEGHGEACAAVEKEEVHGLQRVAKRRLHRLRGLRGLQRLHRVHELHGAVFEKEQPETTKAVCLKKPITDKLGADRIPREIEQEKQNENHLKEGLDNKYDEDLDGLVGFGVENGNLASKKENRNIGKGIKYKISEGEPKKIKIGKNHFRKRRRGVREKVPLDEVV